MVNLLAQLIPLEYLAKFAVLHPTYFPMIQHLLVIDIIQGSSQRIDNRRSYQQNNNNLKDICRILLYKNILP